MSKFRECIEDWVKFKKSYKVIQLTPGAYGTSVVKMAKESQEMIELFRKREHERWLEEKKRFDRQILGKFPVEPVSKDRPFFDVKKDLDVILEKANKTTGDPMSDERRDRLVNNFIFPAWVNFSNPGSKTNIESLARIAIEAAWDEALSTQWQPIETAPKDGTWIDVFGSFKDRFNDPDSYRFADTMWDVVKKEWYGCSLVDINEVILTHWMPIPEGPKE